jgi:acetate---CoA ligase (ADP-forming)
MTPSLRPLFYPTSVAVVGVSPNPQNLGRNIVQNLIEFGFEGIIYEVGISGGIFAGRRIFKSVSDIPDQVGLAVILTPAKTIPGILEECGQKGIRYAVVESAGFSEFGPEGKATEQEVLRVAQKWGIRFVGPNGIGIMNLENGLCTPFPNVKRTVDLGDVSIVSQSGGMGLSIINTMSSERLGLNKFASVGNMLDIGAEDLLDYLIDDPGTRCIGLYLESIHDGKRMMQVARRSPKPILAIKANIGKMSRSIASSHTASLSSDDAVVDAAFRQSGIIRVGDVDALGSYLKVLKLPPMRGDRLAVVSRSGGHAVVAADVSETLGFRLPEFPASFLTEIEKHFRASVVKLTNPLDLGDLFDMDVYKQILVQTLQQENTDGIVFLHTYVAGSETQGSRELISAIGNLSREYDKPIAICVSADSEEIGYLKRTSNYPIYTNPVECIRAMRLSLDYQRQLAIRGRSDDAPGPTCDRPVVASLLDLAKAEGRNLLLHEATRVLQAYGIPSARFAVAQSQDEAAAAALDFGFPVALKVISDQVIHKSDVGGVQLNLRNESAVRDAYDEMMDRIGVACPGAEIQGVLVQPMLLGGRELILGGRQDAQFGPVVVVGLGGIFVEVFAQVAMRVAPVSRQDALEMLGELRGAAILKGARGEPGSDLDAVADAATRLSQLLCDFPAIREVDINPLRVFRPGAGCVALDARILL